MLALLLLACAQMAIEGTVVDVEGQPIEGARITAIPSQCQAVSDAEGHFELTCATGTYEITAGHAGYVSATIERFDATERKRYDVGRMVLVPIPEEKGLLLYADTPKPLEPALLERRTGRGPDGPYRAYCLPAGVEQPATVVPAGPRVFYDHEAPDWHLFRLDDEGCAYRMARRDGRWQKVWAQSPEVERKELEPGLSLVRVQLEPGRYFIAHWEGGFFTKGSLGDRKGYTGYLLKVE